MAIPPLITFLSDYGRVDEFVAVCTGVIWRIAPRARVLDVSHDIAPGNIRGGALALARAIPYLPKGTHLAIVDPGVGTDRKAIGVETTDGRRFVGPDNGLLSPGVAICGGAVRAVELDPIRWGVEDPSATFAGRDVFAPAAGALAAGADLSELGADVRPEELVPLVLPLSQAKGRRIYGVVFWIDRFGNVQTNITQSDLEAVGVDVGDTVQIYCDERLLRVVFVRTFAEVDRGEILGFIDSAGQFSLGINGGSAAEALEIAEGAPVSAERAPSPAL